MHIIIVYLSMALIRNPLQIGVFFSLNYVVFFLQFARRLFQVLLQVGQRRVFAISQYHTGTATTGTQSRSILLACVWCIIAVNCSICTVLTWARAFHKRIRYTHTQRGSQSARRKKSPALASIKHKTKKSHSHKSLQIVYVHGHLVCMAAARIVYLKH